MGDEVKVKVIFLGGWVGWGVRGALTWELRKRLGRVFFPCGGLTADSSSPAFCVWVCVCGWVKILHPICCASVHLRGEGGRRFQ